MFMDERRLTHRQKGVLEFIREFISEHGYAPSLREICVRFGIKGPQNARKHLDALEKKGFIRRSANRSRAIDILPRTGAVQVPIAGRVRAGKPHPAVEDITGYVTLDPDFFKCRGAFMLRVEGQSMVDAGIEDGDYVLVRPQADASNGEIVVAMVDGDATVKRFFRTGRAVVLKPENPQMEPIRLEAGEFSIIGKVVSVIKHMDGRSSNK